MRPRKFLHPRKPRPSNRVCRNSPALDRFWRFVYVTDGCWFWIGSTIDGYGKWNPERGTELRAHRVSYEIHHRVEVPADLFVCHECDIPNCVNPAHLFLGTTQENTADCVAKGRSSCGSNVMRLPPLKAWLATNGLSQREFARRSGIAAPYVTNICNGRKVPGPRVASRIRELTGLEVA